MYDGSSLRTRLEELVGYHARREQLNRPGYCETAETAILAALPPCRNCACVTLHSEPPPEPAPPAPRRHFHQPHFPPALFYDLAFQPTCPACSQAIDARKIKSTRKEKVTSMESPATNSGFCVLTMPDGTEHRLPQEKVFSLLAKLQRTAGRKDSTIPAWLFTKFPALAWFRDCVEAKSDDGSHLHELIMCLVHGPAANPDAPPFDLDDQEERKAS
jgi:hypothetical protein